MLPETENIPEDYDIEGKNAPVVATYKVRVVAVDGVMPPDESASDLKHVYATVRVDGCKKDKTKWSTNSAKVGLNEHNKNHAEFRTPARKFGVRRPALTVVTLEVWQDFTFRDVKLNYFSFPLGAANPGTHTVPLDIPESYRDTAATITFELIKE